MIIFILTIILFTISCVLFYQAKQIKTARYDEIAYIQKQIQNKEHELQRTLRIFYQNQRQIKELLKQKSKLNQQIEQQQKQLHETLLNKQEHLNQQYEHAKQQTTKAFESYCNILDQQYNAEQHKFTTQINTLKTKREQVESQITQIQKVYEAAAAARLREKEEQDKKRFYQIQLSEKQIIDITKIEEWKSQLSDPSIVGKIIWSSYVMKATSDLCNRVVGSTIVCGIYKITNLLTNDIYIGQSLNIADRFKQHIKCGLGIDAPSTNKLYNNMQEYGVWHFTFEILQKCSRDKLNEKERFWIEMYQSNKVGMNVTKGNK